MPVKTYDMPLISSGLRQEEFIRQMVDSLEYLEAVSSDIFNLISISVAEQKNKLIDINTRINKAEAKVEKLKTSSSRGTIVYSLPKYPAPPVLEDQRPIFSKVKEGICKVHRSKGEIVSKLEPATDHHLRESTAYYILPADVWPSESQLMEGGFRRRLGRKAQDENEGLGSLPRYLPSVSSLMLFNTSENPYLKYIIIDPLSGVINKTREQHEEREGPSEAPNSILTREDLTRYAPGSFGYRPIMSAISEIDVPDILPDLPNVAENIMYEADLGPSIAPSLANVLLPTLTEVETSSILSEPAPSISDLPPPTPLPPDPIEIQPPPPDEEELQFASSSEGSEDSTPAASPDPGDDRGALLRQIESFKKTDALKPLQQRMERKALKQKRKDDSQGGALDVLSDLKNRLNLRREGISGHKKEGGAHVEKRESMLEQMSYIIPPPRSEDIPEAVMEDSNEDWSS